MAASDLIALCGNFSPRFSVFDFPGFGTVQYPDDETLTAQDFSQNGTWLAQAKNGGHRVLNVSDWSQVSMVDPITYNTHSAAFSPDSSRLAIGSNAVTPSLKVYDTSTWQFVTLQDMPADTYSPDVSFSLDGGFLAVALNGSNYGMSYELYDASTFFRLSGYPNSSSGYVAARGVRVSERTNLVVIAVAGAPHVFAVDLTTKLVLWESTDTMSFQGSPAKILDLSPDGTLVAVAATGTPYLFLYDAVTGTPVTGPTGGNAPTAGLSSVAFDIEGKYLCAGVVNYGAGARVLVWDTATWTLTTITDTPNNIGWVPNVLALNGAEDAPPVTPPTQNPILQGMDF